MLVSGGPTGKTWTVARLLALQIEQATAAGRPAPAIVLAAPTGKAATRLEEAIAKERATLPVADPVRLALPSRARTLHRVLGSVGGSSTRFRHGEGAPLPADLVVVDEASMIDVGLFRRLLDALGPRRAWCCWEIRPAPERRGRERLLRISPRAGGERRRAVPRPPDGEPSLRPRERCRTWRTRSDAATARRSSTPVRR